VPSMAQQYLNANVPGMISKELFNYLPKYLAQNQQMHEIMQKHSSQMEGQLETRSRSILEKITNDPNYHVIHRAFYDSVDRRANDALSAAEKKFDKTAKTKMAAFDEQALQIQKLQYENRDLKNSLFWQQVISGTHIVGTLGAIAYFVIKQQQ